MKSTDHWFPFYPGPYLADTVGLSLAQRGAYLLAMIAYWTNGGPLPDSDLKAICDNHCNRVSRFFVRESVKVAVNGHGSGSVVWRHKRIDHELEKAKALKAAQTARTEAARAALERTRAAATETVTESVTEVATEPVTNSPLPLPVLISDKASDKVSKRWQAKQRETAQRFEEVLGKQWRNDAGKWVNRIKSHHSKAARVIAEVASAVKEQRISSTPAQYAEQIWKEFK